MANAAHRIRPRPPSCPGGHTECRLFRLLLLLFNRIYSTTGRVSVAKRKGEGVAIQVHQLVEKFWETKTIQYNSNDNCYVFCYKNQIETRQASERRGGEVGQVSASSGVDEKLCTPYAACLRPRKCLLNRFILAQNTSSSETCNVSIHFKHTILIEGERVEDTIYYYLCLALFSFSFHLSRSLPHWDSLQFQRKFRNHSGH